MKKFTSVYMTAVILVLAAVMSFSVTAYAENDNEDPISERSTVEQSTVEPEPEPEPEPSIQSEPEPQSEPDPSTQPEPEPEPEPQSQQDPEPSQQTEPSQETEPEPEPDPEPSYESTLEDEPEPAQYEQGTTRTESSTQTSESTKKPTAIKITDPFAALRTAAKVIPSNKASASAESNAAILPQDKARTGASINNGGLIEPPVPAIDASLDSPYNSQSDNNSVLMGLIFWSMIGVIVTAILIIILNFKGDNSEFVFSRKRYHKGENRNNGIASKYRTF